MKNLITLLSLAGSLLVACEEPLCLTGSGQTAQYDLELADFDKISVSGPVNLNLSQGNEQQVSVVAEPEMFAALEYDVRNGRLEIGYDNVRCWNTNQGVSINVRVPSVSDLTFDGAGTIRSIGDLQLPELGMRTSGDVKIDLSGNCTFLYINSDGTLEANNYGLETEKATIDIQGSAIMELSCSQSLDIDVQGSAKISYKGQPAIRQKVSGDLDLINAN